MEALNFQMDATHLLTVVRAVSEVSVDDALTIDPARTDVQTIREGDDYSGLRVKIFGHVYENDVSYSTIDGPASTPADTTIIHPTPQSHQSTRR